LIGEMKKVGRRFGSATRVWRRAVDGCAWRGNTDRSGGSSGETEEEESLGGPVLGQKAVVTWVGIGISKENQDGLP
jgi:hypothetical protein